MTARISVVETSRHDGIFIPRGRHAGHAVDRGIHKFHNAGRPQSRKREKGKEKERNSIGWINKYIDETRSSTQVSHRNEKKGWENVMRVTDETCEHL